MTLLGLFFGLATILLAGSGVTMLLLGRRSQLNALEGLALAWLSGTATISLGLWLAGFFVSGVGLQSVIISLALSLGAFAFFRLRRGGVRLRFPWPRGAVERIGAAVLVFQFLAMTRFSMTQGLGWDGWMNWEIKARYAFLNGGVLPGAYLADATRGFSHPAYPLWIPFTELWLYLCLGAPHQFWIKVLPACFYGAGAILVALLARRLTEDRRVGMIVAAFLFCLPALSSSEGGAHSGYADVPLAFVYLTALGYLVCQANKIDPAGWRVYALALALLPWMKREGVILWAIGAVCGLVVIIRQRRSWSALLWLLPGPALLLGWKSYLAANHTIAVHEYLPMTWSTLDANLPRVGPIGRAVFAEMIDVTRWSLFWPILALAFLTLLWRARDFRLFIIFVAVAAPLAIYRDPRTSSAAGETGRNTSRSRFSGCCFTWCRWPGS